MKALFNTFLTLQKRLSLLFHEEKIKQVKKDGLKELWSVLLLQNVGQNKAQQLLFSSNTFSKTHVLLWMG